MRIAIITNMPAPYRIPIWNEVGEKLGKDFMVFFCCVREPNRQWDIPEIKFQHQYLKENFKSKHEGNTFVHNNRDIWKKLTNFKPDVIITGGFNPTMLYAFLYTKLKGKKHIPISDAWQMSEKHLSAVHTMIRKLVFRFSHAFVACSEKGKIYYQSYGIKKESVFISHYTIANELPHTVKAFEFRKYDVMFSGQFTERKNPLFFIKICKILKKDNPDLKVLLLGDGPLRDQMLQELNESGVQYEYPGYVRQDELHGFYENSKLFLFPTAYDAWGVVANEALVGGTPVIVTPFAGCSDELIIDHFNGFVAPLDLNKWVNCCNNLLQDKTQWFEFSENGRRTASEFRHSRAAEGILAAVDYSQVSK